MANSIANDKKMAVFFLSMFRGKMYSLLQDLLAPEKPQDKLLPVLFQELKEHYKSQPLVIAESFYFHRRGQGANKSITEYIAELQQLTTNCEFGEYLNSAFGLPYSVSSKGRWPNQNQAIRS